MSIPLVLGCRSKSPTGEEGVFRESQQLFEQYLGSDAAIARKSLEQEIKLLENSNAELYLPRKATVLFTECCRLYVLEKRLGNDQAAELALIKARYWNLRRYEADENLTTDKEFWSLTPERIFKIVDESDKVHTGGKGPRYIQGN